MLISLFLEEFAVLHLNMAGFLEVVQRSHTGGSLNPHMWEQWAKKKLFFTSNFQPLPKIISCRFFVCGWGRDDYYSC